MNMSITELVLTVKILKDISYMCNAHGDCSTCIFRDVVCPKENRLHSDSPYLPEEWDYNLLIDRISKIDAKVGE